MLAALRFRWAQALVLVVLSTLVTTCFVLAPLYTRALQQATTGTLLGRAAPETTALRLLSTSGTSPELAIIPSQLVETIPADVRGYFGDPVASHVVNVRREPLGSQPGGQLLYREGMCEHVRFTTGRCPEGLQEIAISTDQAAAYAMKVGTTFDVGEFDTSVSVATASPYTTVTVVGTYQQVDGPYWFGDQLTGRASLKLGYDAMLTPESTLTEAVKDPSSTQPLSWLQPEYRVDLPFRPERVGFDQISGLGAALADFTKYPLGPRRSSGEVARTITVTNGIPAIADTVAIGSSQASVTVPLLMAQLGLLIGCVLWLVLVAAADGRRGEVALARLRGRGAAGARRLLLAETLPPVVLGVPLGGAAAIGATTVARHTYLTSDPPYELPWGAVIAPTAALVFMVGLSVLSVRRVCRDPVASLLRSVPHRRVGFRLGVLEAMLVAAALAVFAAVLTGRVQGPVGQITPTMLALAAGVLASRALAGVLSVIGQWLLRRGRATTGAALVASSRRGTTRWLVPVVVVALCVVVVTADTLAVGSRNWAGRAQAEVGALTSLSLASVDLPTVAQAVEAVDPTGDLATPVAMIDADPSGGVATIGVVPDSFRKVALFPGLDPQALAWDQVTAPAVAPLVLTGTRLRYHVTSSAFTVVSGSIGDGPTSLLLSLSLVGATGEVAALPLGEIDRAGTDADQSFALPCKAGCRVAGIGLLAPPGATSVTGTATISKLTLDGAGLDLGATPASAGSGATPPWRDTLTEDVGAKATFANETVTMTYATNGVGGVFVVHASIPDVVPALTTPPSTPQRSGLTVGGNFMDGSQLLVRSVGTVGFVPGGPAEAAIVNLDNLLAESWQGRGSAHLQVFVASSDPAVVARVSGALAERGLTVTATTYSRVMAADFASSAAAWSLQLAGAVALLSLVVAGVGILVLASTSRRARSRDYAGLRLVGESRRTLSRFAQLETVPVIAASALIGLAIGLWASPVAVSFVPLFTNPPASYPLQLDPAWLASLGAGLVALLVMVVVGLVTSRRAAAQAKLQRLRDPV